MNQAEIFRRLAGLARHIKAVRLQADTLEQELLKLLADIAAGDPAKDLEALKD